MPFLYNYFLFDAAKADENLSIAQELNPDHKCLYLVKPYDELLTVGPYLFSIKEKTAFWELYLSEGWSQSWGFLLFSNSPFEHVFTHFRKFLMIKTEDDQQLYFRFYDPRVLRIFLPTCDEKQLKEFFGPIEQFICEDEDPEFALVFSFEKNSLKRSRISKEEIFGQTAEKNRGRKFFV